MFKVEGLRPVLFGPYDFSLAPGDCLVVTGPSGSGKSLLLRALADLDPSTGKVSLDNIDRNSMPASRWRRKVRYVAAEPGWWRETAAAHFDEPDAVTARLGEIGLEEDVMERSISRLSTGERQRLAILRALDGLPDVLLLDEPTASLDQKSARNIETLLKAELKRGCAMVLVTHSAAQARRFATKTIKLQSPKQTGGTS